jgi:hypothetical protein
LVKGASDPPAVTPLLAPKLTVPVRKVNTAVPIEAAVLLAPMLATLVDATAAALLAFAGGKVAANVPGRTPAFPIVC